MSDFKVVLTCENARPPIRADNGCAGYDLTSVDNVVLKPSERKLISTGLIIQIPNDSYARVAPRSGLSVKGIDVGAGVVDLSFRGIVKVLLINNSQNDYEVKIGDRIAQLILEKIFTPEVEVVNSVEDLSCTERGQDGFGSTGR